VISAIMKSSIDYLVGWSPLLDMSLRKAISMASGGGYGGQGDGGYSRQPGDFPF
jgi:hypothetical protein